MHLPSHAMPGEGYESVLQVISIATGPDTLRYYFNPYQDPQALRKAQFNAALQELDEDYNSSRLPVSVLISTDDPTAEFIPIQDPAFDANPELRTWLVQLPTIVEVYPLPFLPLDQEAVISFNPSNQDRAQILWLYALLLKDIEESPWAKWSLQDRIMDDFDNAQAANAQLNGADDADDAELFGSDSGSIGSLNEDVGSGDEDRRENAKDDINDNKDPVHTREENVIDVTIGKHAIPKPSDGEVSSLTQQIVHCC